ncbi:uncharacterized protein PHALS_04444 [Plasmopara halstedii]|uniref:Uncharacterized protein n=1 Tax=Plasmopara halstedii TaxID=4781 RepID=A0A0P1B2E7_PLAHL|nr:uncharacterized protein PHALS_04444 [Plasmopara halstedii]CEG47576.1 hypothetical protein PHALS_04444 [Plasmopara halstedii]|eukprot:XP_024583945.1 hypothetical protein PHALS_04444 [Plasmopara halstedii]
MGTPVLEQKSELVQAHRGDIFKELHRNAKYSFVDVISATALDRKTGANESGEIF